MGVGGCSWNNSIVHGTYKLPSSSESNSVSNCKSKSKSGDMEKGEEEIRHWLETHWLNLSNQTQDKDQIGDDSVAPPEYGSLAVP
eukprot:12100611-Ditylum_brightwellii.AAC.1